MTIPGANDLHQAFYAAIEAADADALNELLRQHFDEVVVQFKSWAVVPESIRADQVATQSYVQSLVAIARVFEQAGEPSLIKRLMGEDDSNPIFVWQRKLRNAQALSEAGEYEESNQQLLQILAELEPATGSAVVNLRPKVFGSLGYNALHQEKYDAAVDYNSKAHEASIAADDDEGIATYYENLVSLRAIQLWFNDPLKGKVLLELRRKITQAQDSADAGRYQASSKRLNEALATIETDPTDPHFRALLPKVYGLLGFIENKLGNLEEARKQTEIALEESKSLGDSEGVRIYSANLEQ